MNVEEDPSAKYTDQLLNLMREVPGNRFFCKDKKGIFLWHNNCVIAQSQLKPNSLIGKTVFDIFHNNTAKFSTEHDLEVMNSNTIVTKTHNVQLINGNAEECLITKQPWMMDPKKIGGILVNCINTNSDLCERFKSSSVDNQQEQTLGPQLQYLHFNFKQPLKEIILLSNLIMLKKINNTLKSLCLELQDVAKKLLSDCDDILASKGILDACLIPAIPHKIDLKELIQEIFNKQVKIFRSKNIKLFLTTSNQIPEIIFGDLFRIKKTLQLTLKIILEQIQFVNNKDTNIYFTTELFHKINNKIIILSFIFQIDNYVLRNIIDNEQQNQENIKLILTSDKEYNNISGLQFLKILIKELGGDLKISSNKHNAEIMIHLPVKILD